ncbi:MAG: hypothetical protein R3B40_23055 [Polyangiales bacterium]
MSQGSVPVPVPVLVPVRARRVIHASLVTLLAVAGVGCGDSTPAEPASAPLEQPAAPAASSAFQVNTDGSAVDFIMEAPLENIHGRAPSSVHGELDLDLAQLSASTALVRIDLFQLEVLQQKRESADEAFGEEVRNETQNEHVRTWFEISPDAPEDVREANRWAEFRVERVEGLSADSVAGMTGAERVVQATLHGQLRIHGHTVAKSARVELTFTYEGDRATGVRVRSLEPVSVGLEEYDVRPRSAFGTLAQRTLAALGEKVATAAPVTFDFRASPAAATATP